ncbi:MAG: rhamnulokinase [Ardenticatenaceae bacterium]|nr:rhamnulokinase [Ardenticatenaceae bacterium]
MNQTTNYLAVDLGASSGRVVLGRWDGDRFALQELHRFPNGPVNILSHWYSDVLRLWSEIKAGLAHYAGQFDTPLAGIGVDTWGVDCALLDRAGHLLGNPYHYRDARTDGVMERAFERVPRHRIFEQTGLQFIQFNTLFQLYSTVLAAEPQLEMADTLLMLPDLFHYWLTGRKVSEYTIASTSQMLHARDRRWATELLADLGLPAHLLPPIVAPGTVFGDLRPEVMAEVGIRRAVPVIAPGSHDTASAVAAVPDLDADSAYISSGTWSLMGVETAEPIINERALALNFTNEGGVANTIRLLKNIAGLWLIQESQRQWQREGQTYSVDRLLALADRAEPFRSLVDPDAPDFLSPGDMPAAIRAYCRRTGQPQPESVGTVVRCCLESLALKYRRVLDDLETLIGRRIETIRIVGGGSLNRQLCQFTADACERAVVAGPVEATALGNIMLQAIATGHLPDVTSGRQAVAASVRRQHYEPSPSAAWQEAFGRFGEIVMRDA